MVWINHFEIASIVILISIMIMFYTGDRIHTKASKVFRYLIWSVLATAVVDELSVLALTNTSTIPHWISVVFVVLYNLGLTTIVWLYVLYVVYITHSDIRSIRKPLFLICIPLAIEMALIILSVFNGFVFSIDNNGIYHRGAGMTQWFVVAGFYTLYVGYICLKRRRFMSRMERISVVCWTTSLIICQILQLIYSNLLLNSFGCALGVLFCYISIQGDFVDTDRILGTYSNIALAKKINSELEAGKKFEIIAVRLGGFDEINVIFGYSVAEDVLHGMAEFLSQIVPGHQVFYTTGPIFACYVEGGREEARHMAERINQKLTAGIYSNDAMNRIPVPYGITIISCPDQADTPQRYNALINMVLKEPTLSNDRSFEPVTDDIIRKYNRRIDVERALERAVRNGAFEVLYQPIVDITTGKVFSAEALIRLHDEKYGDIFPEEFIPIAEENGAIIQITNFVLSAVCRFIKEHEIEKLGLRYIEVNLSAVECIRPHTASRLLSLIESYGVDKSLINMEITETAAVGNNLIVRDNLDSLIEAGVTFSLDDYGTGYSNMTELLELPLSIAKVDRSLLWMALDNKEAMCILQNLTVMLRSLGREIVVEGVENKRHEDTLRELNIKYAQGFAYSRPVNEEVFLEYISNVNEYNMPLSEDL